MPQGDRTAVGSAARETPTFPASTERFVTDPPPGPERTPRPGVDYPFPSDGRRLAHELAWVRRVRLLEILLARDRPLTFAQNRWLAERDPLLSPRRLRSDLLALLNLGLVTRCGFLGHRADYAASLAGLEDGGVVAPDSTGVQTTSFGGWREEKHGEKREKRWLKVHAMVGTKTHVVIRAVVSDTNSGDCPQFEPLRRGALEDGFRPEIVVADKGYLSRDNYTLAADLGLGAYIPFKSNSVGRSEGAPAWRRAYHLFQANRAEFDRNYHRRSNVESVFSALKRKFGENIRSRNPVAQVNEVLCKLIAYNLTVVVHEMFENGVTPSFEAAPQPGNAS